MISDKISKRFVTFHLALQIHPVDRLVSVII